MTMTSTDFLSDTSLLSPTGVPRRKTADMDELKAMLGMSVHAKEADSHASASTSVLDSSSSRIDAEETVVLQDLLQLSQIDRSAQETSNMDISGSDSDHSVSNSRRTTMGLGEMKAMLMQELDRYDRRSSVSQRMSVTETDTLPSQPLLDILRQNPIPEEKEPSISDSESTMDLQQYASQLRQELSSHSAAPTASARESLTTDLQAVAREVLNMDVLNQKQVTEQTDAMLSRMSGPLSSAAVAAMDDTVTEDLRRLSQLLTTHSAQKPRFSPLVARSGAKQVIHSVKSTQKYEHNAPEQVRVITSMPARPLFQEEEKEKEEEKSVVEELPPQETSINLDAYFLPKSSHSLLDDSTPRLESMDVECDSKEASEAKEVAFRASSIGSLPSPIADHSIRLEESSIGEWDEKDAKDSVEKVDDSLEENKETDKKEVVETDEPGKECRSVEKEVPALDNSLKEKVDQISRLANVNLFQEKSMLQLAQICRQVLDHRSETMQLCSLFHEYQDKKQQQVKLEELRRQAEQEWREKEASFASQLRTSPPLQVVAAPVDEKREEENLRQEFTLLEQELGINIVLQSDHQYSILLQREKRPVAAIQVLFLEDKRAALKVVLHTNSSRTVRKRIEARLPVKSEWKVEMKDMREQICRCIWIIDHSF